MTAFLSPRFLRVLSGLLLGCLLVGAGLPAFGQNAETTASANAQKKEKLNQLKKAYAAFQKAGKQDNHETAYTKLAKAVRLARETDQNSALQKLRNFQQKLPTKWGNKALEAEAYDTALTHFEKGIEWSPDDAYVHYGKGLALVNIEDSTTAGLESLKKAISVGEETGNTKVAGLATERIRDEFIARASKALSGDNPSASQINAALEALDEMRTYVDPNAKSLFYRARALYEKEQYSDALTTAQNGLKQHQGSRSDAAKYHFIVAESHMNLGNEDAACTTFQKATYGDYKARAEHYLENECK